MKKLISYTVILFSALFLSACHDDNNFYEPYDNTPPSAPQGLVVYNGDNRADIVWDYNTENDVAGYNVYYSYTYDGKYTLIGSTEKNYFTDYDAQNGDKYYYAVVAYDYNGNESDLSHEEDYGTPRPEGFNAAVSDYLTSPGTAGFSFTSYSAVPYDDQTMDFYFENYEGTYYVDVSTTDTDIQDMGPTNDIYDITYAPSSGWSATHDAIAKVGHTYVIWTYDNHFAKIRVKNISGNRMVFDWAFQLREGEIKLKPKANNGRDNREVFNTGAQQRQLKIKASAK